MNESMNERINEREKTKTATATATFDFVERYVYACSMVMMPPFEPALTNVSRHFCCTSSWFQNPYSSQFYIWSCDHWGSLVEMPLTTPQYSSVFTLLHGVSYSTYPFQYSRAGTHSVQYWDVYRFEVLLISVNKHKRLPSKIVNFTRVFSAPTPNPFCSNLTYIKVLLYFNFVHTIRHWLLFSPAFWDKLLRRSKTKKMYWTEQNKKHWTN